MIRLVSYLDVSSVLRCLAYAERELGPTTPDSRMEKLRSSLRVRFQRRTPHSDKIGSPSPLLELPPEIWLKIFRIATFIPLETDLSATTVEPGPFCSYNKYQARSFKVVLPLRRTIVLVSRRFYQIGAEILYTTFHVNTERIKIADRRLSLFSSLLVLRPELGRFVRRLSLQWSVKDEEKNYQIISRCPNVVIFSSSIARNDIGIRHLPWWGRGLPKTIRSFDADVHGVPMKDVVSLLAILSHLEILHLWALEGDSISHAPICLSSLRILSVYPSNIDACLPVLSTMQLPRVTALATNARRSFPLHVWQQLEYFKPGPWSYDGLYSDYFHNLRHLHLLGGPDRIQGGLRYFPFHQLECLTLHAAYLPYPDANQWQETLEPLVVLPLDANVMPMLKLFQLEWTYVGIYAYYRDYIDSAKSRDQFIQYFEALVSKFEERGVLFVEAQEPGIRSRFELVHDILAVCKRSSVEPRRVK
jgi:hypothetical protein